MNIRFLLCVLLFSSFGVAMQQSDMIENADLMQFKENIIVVEYIPNDPIFSVFAFSKKFAVIDYVAREIKFFSKVSDKTGTISFSNIKGIRGRVIRREEAKDLLADISALRCYVPQVSNRSVVEELKKVQ